MALSSSPKWWKVQPFHRGVSMTGNCQRVWNASGCRARGGLLTFFIFAGCVAEGPVVHGRWRVARGVGCGIKALHALMLYGLLKFAMDRSACRGVVSSRPWRAGDGNEI